MKRQWSAPGVRRRMASPEEAMAILREMEEANPGYREENEKLTTIVKTLTGVRFLYGVFYMAMLALYGMRWLSGLTVFVSCFIFYFWFSAMLRSGKFLAVMMLIFRGGSIIYNGASILGMAYWLPYPLVFTLAAASIIEFCESVFCIYILFNAQAAWTVKLNRQLTAALARGATSSKTLEEMAEYQNPYQEEEDKDTTEEP